MPWADTTGETPRAGVEDYRHTAAPILQLQCLYRLYKTDEQPHMLMLNWWFESNGLFMHHLGT